MPNRIYRPKETSWISFNGRVLQEASDATVPLMERIKFLGIYSSNLDEFFEVRVATLKRLIPLGKKTVPLLGAEARKILSEIQDIIWTKHLEFESCVSSITRELELRGIHFITENELNPEQASFLKDYFTAVVRPRIFPIMISRHSPMPVLKDRAIYLMVRLSSSQHDRMQYSLIEVPSDVVKRFTVLPKVGDKRFVIFLDDVIRFGLHDIFSAFGYDRFEAYDIKLTRDAELDISDDLTESLLNKITKGLQRRHAGAPVRISYDAAVPEEMLDFFLKKMKLKKDETFVPGGRYHNFKDFMDFPRILGAEDSDPARPPIPHRALMGRQSILAGMRERDILLHFPYQSFTTIIDLLREASMDPDVRDIKITLYRVARNSSIVNALINAIKNGKTVTVIMEIQARFDEKNNIHWAGVMKEEGVNVLLGIPGLKVHSKLCMITRREQKKDVVYSVIGTGNFNENTARLYTDHYLLTCNSKITREVASLFQFFEMNYRHSEYKTLMVSPFNMRKKLIDLIRNETRIAERGEPAYLFFKLNNLVDFEIIKHLYKASSAGVRIRLIVRGMFSLIAGRAGLSENIEARGLVDRYLEHSRVYLFGNAGKELCFISSADLMNRNLNGRIEVTCPILDETLHAEIRDIMEILWKDNVKARVLDENLGNRYYRAEGSRVRAQDAIYEYLKEKHLQE